LRDTDGNRPQGVGHRRLQIHWKADNQMPHPHRGRSHLKRMDGGRIQDEA
jgi:hypothetical protein